MLLEINGFKNKDSIKDESLKNKIPDGAIYFEGIVSDGEKNRNGYIIETNAWFFDNNKFVDDFLKTGSVLYNHDDDKPIGRPLSLEKIGDKIQVTGYVFDDTYSNGAIGRGLILGLSTGHITHESLWRHDDGTEMDEGEFMKKIWSDDKVWEDFINGLWTWVVTKAEIVEFSFVTTRSNRASHLVNHIAELLEINKVQANNLVFNKKYMNKKDLLKAKKVNGVDEATKETTDETIDEEKEDNKVIINGKELSKEEVEKVVNFLEKGDEQENSLKEMEKSFDEKLENSLKELKENLIKEMDNKIEQIKINKRKEEKENIANIVNTDNNEVKSISDFKKKHSKK